MILTKHPSILKSYICIPIFNLSHLLVYFDYSIHVSCIFAPPIRRSINSFCYLVNALPYAFKSNHCYSLTPFNTVLNCHPLWLSFKQLHNSTRLLRSISITLKNKRCNYLSLPPYLSTKLHPFAVSMSFNPLRRSITLRSLGTSWESILRHHPP